MTKSILDKNARHHLRLITGNNDNVFICDDLVSRNFDEYIHYHLRKKGFEKIIFFDGAGNLGEYYLDENSAQLVRAKATQKKKKSRRSFLDDDDEEVVEEYDNDDMTLNDDLRLKFPEITTGEFLTTYKAQISDKEHKTAIVFSNIINFMNSQDDIFQAYYDFFQHGMDQSNENLTIFLAKEQAIESIQSEFKNYRNNYFLDLFKSNFVHEVGSPDNHEIQLFLRKLKIIGMPTLKGNRYIDFDEVDLDMIAEVIRMAMLDLTSQKNRDEITRRYASSEQSPHVTLNHMSMGEIYSVFEDYFSKTDEKITYLDDKKIREIFNYKDELEKDPFDLLMKTKGWETVAKVIKKELQNFQSESKKNHYQIEWPNNRLEVNEGGYQYPCPNYMLIGNPGVGKTTVAKLIGRIFKENGILKNGNVITVNSSALIGEYVGQTPSKTNRLIDSAKGGVLIIDEAYSLYADPHAHHDDNSGAYRKEAIDTLVARALDNDVCIILAGYRNTRKLYEMNEGLPRRFTEIEIPNYEPELLEDIFRNLCKKDYLLLSESIDLTGFIKNLKNFSPKRSFGNAGEIEKVYHSVKQNVKNRDPYTNEIIYDDFKEFERYFMDVGNQKIVDSIIDKIDKKYVGMDNVKELIQNLRYEVLRVKEAEKKGIEITRTKRNILLIGNPGTGKTTTANLLAEFYYEMGVLASNEIISLKANTTSSFDLSLHIEEANDKGKLLFIDEANYYCHIGNAGKEMISPLLNPSEDFKNYPDLIIVMAIYPENKEIFYNLDSGMARRFREFVLNDYNAQELYQIFEIQRKTEQLELSSEVNEYGYTVSDYIQGYFMYQERIGNVERNNAALVADFLSQILKARIRRITDGQNEADEITLSDFPQVFIKHVTNILHHLNNPNYALEEVYQELNKYEGFDNVQKHFEDIKTKIEINKENKERGIEETERMNHHILFVGNAGTGKSTMLKLAAKFYTNLGVLSSENPIYFDAKSTLNIERDGESSFIKVLKEANRTGRMLCIDEGNFFVQTASGPLMMHDFIQVAEDVENYPDLIVAICIYPKYLQQFLALDDGMARRFEIIELHNYTSEELYHMFENIVHQHKLEISEDAKKDILNIFEELVNNGKAEVRNASLPKKVFEEMNMIRYRRGKQDEKQKYILTKEDVMTFNEEKLDQI